MDKRLFVGNLPFSMTSDTLKAIFSPFGGIVSAEVVINKLTNRSKGFGFVEYSTNPEAQTAIDALNDTEQEGRKIIVAFAKPRPDQAAPEQPTSVQTFAAADELPVVENTTETLVSEEAPVELNVSEIEPAAETTPVPTPESEQASVEIGETDSVTTEAIPESPESTTDNKA